MTPRVLWLSMVKVLRRGPTPEEIAIDRYVAQREAKKKSRSANGDDDGSAP